MRNLSEMTSGTRRLLQLAIALIVGVIGVGGFFLFIPHTTIQSTKLDEFVVPSPKLSRLVATPNQFTGVLLSHDPSPAIVAAAAADPAHTGAFSIEWFANNHDGTSLDIYIETMPTNALTTQVFNTAKSQGISSAGLKKIDYDLTRQFGIPGIPGAAAASYHIVHAPQPGATSKPLPPTPAITVVFSKGHVVFAMQVASYLLNQDQVLALARAEYAQVSKVLPTFTSLRVKADPPLATGLWIGIAGALFIVLVTLPWALESRGESRRRRDEARARFATRSRGSKVARRRGASR
jgi:uncharacterized membrane protein YfcA